MRANQRKMTIGFLRTSVLLLAMTTPATLMSTSDRSPKFNPPKSYDLALGDSFTYGFQESKFIAGLPPSAYNTGYVDDFGSRLRQIQPHITTINYGCPGETTESFIHGPCLWTATGHELHDAFVGSQLDGAVAFLKAHPGEVSPITITLWGNDVREFTNDVCHLDPGCIQSGAPGAIARISTNLAFILGQLRAAAPDAEIVVLGAWDGSIGAFAFADPLYEALNVSMASAASAARAHFANPFPTFNPQGDLNLETQTICTLTLECTDGDIHPSDVGYQALANVVFDASGYARLIE